MTVPDGAPRADTEPAGGFNVHLDVFEGPFDLLLGLIAKHKLDITEIALSQVTDEFIGYLSGRSEDWDLDLVSRFLVVAATLLDLKAARLLPSGEVDDEEDLALLEARDLLFARLLQYRAYKEVSQLLRDRFAEQASRFPRRVPLEPRFAGLLPRVLLGLGPAEFARIAARALTPKPPPRVSTEHIHAPVVSVAEQAVVVASRLAALGGRASFRQLTSGSETYLIVATFLALLELFRRDAVSFDQMTALGDLFITWTGDTDSVSQITESDEE